MTWVASSEITEERPTSLPVPHPKGLVVHFLTDCHSRTTTRDGKVTENRRKAGETTIAAPVAAHTFENLGKSDCKHIHVEAK